MQAPQEMTDDFRNHLWACFKYLGLGEPTPLQYAMADYMQKGPKDFQLQAGRGAGKSVINACFASWRLLTNPNRTIMVISATSDRAIKFISQVRKILDVVPYCEHLKPKEFDKDNAFGFNVGCRTIFGQDLSCYAEDIDKRSEELKELLKETTDIEDCKMIQERITRLSSGVVSIKVGGSSAVS